MPVEGVEAKKDHNGTVHERRNQARPESPTLRLSRYIYRPGYNIRRPLYAGIDCVLQLGLARLASYRRGRS